MEADARRWGSGAIGCAPVDAEGWSENKPVAPQPSTGGQKKGHPKKD